MDDLKDLETIEAILRHNQEVIQEYGTDHAEFSPSGMSIKLNCALSHSLSEGVSEKTNEAAERGTLMHYISEDLLLTGEFPPLDEDTAPLTKEELSIVNDYVAFAKEITANAFWYAVECKVIINPMCWGTADLMALVKEDGKTRLYVVDLKTGFITVEATSTQLKTYGLGAYKAVRDVIEIDEVVAVIVQPRDQEEPVKQHTYDIKEVAAFEHIINRAIDEAFSRTPTWSVGEHCRWCAASPTCPKMIQSLEKIMASESIPLEKAIPMATVAENWAKRVRSRAEDLMTSGVKIPGYKLVHSRGRKQWKESPELYETLEFLFEEEAYQKNYLTPTQALKLSKGDDKTTEEIRQFIEEKEGKLKVVPESDKGESVIVEDLFQYIA